jgi:hypothetical protein
MQLLLNYNYGKIVVGSENAPQTRVAVNIEGGMQHLIFNGFMPHRELLRIQDDPTPTPALETSFFGSSGYRLSSDDSWVFCSDPQKLKAVVIGQTVFCCITADGEPVFTSQFVDITKRPPNNVVPLFSKK